MFSTQPGGQGERVPGPDRGALRRAHDETAHAAAREAAMGEALALIAVLHSADSPLSLVQGQAREAMRAAGMVWETASRLLDP